MSVRRPPGDLGGLVLPLARDTRLKPGAEDGRSGPIPTDEAPSACNPSGLVRLFGETHPALDTGRAEVRPGCATRRRAKGSLELQSMGDSGPPEWSLMLLSHETPLDAELKEQKLCTLTLSPDSIRSLMLSLARPSHALSSASRFRLDMHGEESVLPPPGYGGDSQVDDPHSVPEGGGVSGVPAAQNLFHGFSRSVSSFR